MPSASADQPRLQRRIGFFSAACVVVANMIGTGIFTTSGFILQELGDPAALMLCWLLGGVFALSGALCCAELGASFPRAGGEYAFLRESFGPAMGFLSGWVSLVVGFSAPIAASAIAFAAYLGPLAGLGAEPLAALRVGGLTLAALSPQVLAAVAVIALLTLVHCLGLAFGSRVQNALTLLKLAVLAALLAAGFTLGRGDFSHLGGGNLGVVLDGRFAVSLIFVSFAYSGWNAAAYLGAEIVDPARNLPRALVAGTALVAGLYLAMNLLYLYALPPAAMSGVLDVGAAAAAALFGPRAGSWFGLAIALGLLSVLSSMIMTGPRVYYAMSADRLFFRSLGRLHPARRAPVAAICLQAAVAAAMALTASFQALLIYIGFTLSLFSLCAVAGLMVLRRRGALSGSYRTPGYPVTPLVFILGNLWIVLYSLATSPAAPLLGIATMALGLAVYGHFRRRQPRD